MFAHHDNKANLYLQDPHKLEEAINYLIKWAITHAKAFVGENKAKASKGHLLDKNATSDRVTKIHPPNTVTKPFTLMKLNLMPRTLKHWNAVLLPQS